MRNVRFEIRVNWAARRPSFKIILFEWKWILIDFRGFINRFWQNNFALKSRNGVLNRLRPLLDPAITDLMTLRLLAEGQNDKNRNTVQPGHSSVSLKLALFSFKPVVGCILIQLH